MILEQALLKEHSKKQCDRIVKYIGKDRTRFASLMHLFFTGEYRVTQRASWPVSICIENHPELIRLYIKRLLDNLMKPGIHDAVTRNTMRLLQYVDIPAKYRGQLMNACFELVQSNETAIAIRAFSLTILHRLSMNYPEIVPEIRLIIEDRWQHETPAFRSRAKKIIGKSP